MVAFEIQRTVPGIISSIFSIFIIETVYYIYLHLHLVILQTLLSKATYNWGIHKAIHLEEVIRQRKCS